MPGTRIGILIRPHSHFPLGYAAGEAAALGGAFVGNAARGILIGPGSATLDLVLEMRFRITERANVQFRPEFYNALNRVNFGTPNGNVFLNGNRQADGNRGTVNPQMVCPAEPKATAIERLQPNFRHFLKIFHNDNRPKICRGRSGMLPRWPLHQ